MSSLKGKERKGKERKVLYCGSADRRTISTAPSSMPAASSVASRSARSAAPATESTAALAGAIPTAAAIRSRPLRFTFREERDRR